MIAFWFPGQGSQARGMLDPFIHRPEVRATLAEASALLGWDVEALIRENPEGKLDRTEFTQPALFATSIALWRVWQAEGGPAPQHVAGHSLGEWTALVVAGVLDFADALKLVAVRAQAMAEAVPAGAGAMSALLGLDDAAVEAVCAEASSEAARVWAANYNAPGQVVIAGDAEAVERAEQLARARGARRVVRLRVSVPSHTPRMAPAQARLGDAMAQARWRDATVPVWSNVDAAPHTAASEIRDLLLAQLVRPVRWAQLVRAMREAGVSAAVEMGPGNVLAGLARRIERGLTTYTLPDEAALRAAVAALNEEGR